MDLWGLGKVATVVGTLQTHSRDLKATTKAMKGESKRLAMELNTLK